MRALRSRTVQSDSASNVSDTEKPIKIGKRNKKSKKTSKKKQETSTDISLQSQSTETDEFMKSPHKKSRKTEEFTKSKRASRNSTNSIKQALKENISPNIKKTDSQHSRKNKKSHRNEKTSEESLEFKNVVTSTAIKPKRAMRDSSKIVVSGEQESHNGTRLSRTKTNKTVPQNFDLNETENELTTYKNKKRRSRESTFELTHNSQESHNGTRLSRNKTNKTVSEKFDINETENELITTKNKKNNSTGSTFELTRISQEYSPTFKNIVTSTTIKPKKRKQSNNNKKATKSKNSSKEAMEIDNDNVSSKILLENDIINISDGIASNTDEIKTNITDVLNSTYLKIDEESPPILTTNNSGQWKIEDQKSVINISDDTKMFESTSNKEIFTSPVDTNKDTKKVVFQDKSLSKSARKKWQRYPRNSQGANSVLEQISTPQKKSLPNNKSLNISQKINKTGNTTTTQSANKIKRTAMPNFALIHQKAYEKMESITEYSQRKKNRANLLLSNKKVQMGNESTDTGSKTKSSRQLFSNEKPNNTSKIKFNRFGFKVKSPLAITNKQQPPVKPLIKPSIYERNEILAIANKKVQNTGKVREIKRDVLKGVRTNRRFELLMKMRNN